MKSAVKSSATENPLLSKKSFLVHRNNSFPEKVCRPRADGKIRPCLFSDVEFDAFDALRNGTDADVAAIIEKAIATKPADHHEMVGTERGMSQIGG